MQCLNYMILHIIRELRLEHPYKQDFAVVVKLNNFTWTLQSRFPYMELREVIVTPV